MKRLAPKAAQARALAARGVPRVTIAGVLDMRPDAVRAALERSGQVGRPAGERTSELRLRLPPELAARIGAIAAREGRTLNAVVVQALQRALG